MRTDGRTDGHDEANSRFSLFFESVKKNVVGLRESAAVRALVPL